jgi:hypothetical protein
MCACRVCVYGREVSDHLSSLTEEQAKFFGDMYDQLCHCELDRDFHKLHRDILSTECRQTLHEATTLIEDHGSLLGYIIQDRSGSLILKNSLDLLKDVDL